jgi:hypothetical protein
MRLCAARNGHREEIDIAQLVRDVRHQAAVGRNCGREFIARSVGNRYRLAAFSPDPVQLEIAGAVHDVCRVDEAGAVGHGGEALQKDNILRPILGERHLHHDWRTSRRHRPDLRRSAALLGE